MFQSDLSYDIVDNIISNFRNKRLSNDESWENEFINQIKNQIKINATEEKINDRIILIVGVNGTGKTTTSAKLCNFYKNNGEKITLIVTIKDFMVI